MKASLRGIASIIALGTCLYTARDSFGALAVALGKVNTSVGLLPNSVTNKWKLQCDPDVLDTSDAVDPASASLLSCNPNDQVFVSGSLSSTYDPTLLTLYNPGSQGNSGGGVPEAVGSGSTNLSSSSIGNIGNGNGGSQNSGPAINYQNAVVGMGAYDVTGYDIMTTTGGYYAVQLNTNCGGFGQSDLVGSNTNQSGKAVVTTVGDVSGGEAGEVFDIQFQIDKNKVKSVVPDTCDQYFFQVNLNTIDGQGTTDAGPASIFADMAEGLPADSLTIGPRNDPFDTQDQTTITADNINPSFTGEILDAGFSSTLTDYTSTLGALTDSTSTLSAVPEPASAGLLLGASAFALLRRRRASVR